MMDMVGTAAAGSYVGIKPPHLDLTSPNPTTLLLSHTPQSLTRSKALKASSLNSVTADSSSRSKGRTVGGQLQLQPNNKSHEVSQSSSRRREVEILEKSSSKIKIKKKRRVFLLDVNSLCYKGENPSLHTFAHWISLFFSQISLDDPVIAVIDGERGNAYRRKLLPSYKVNRKRVTENWSPPHRFVRSPVRRSHELVSDFLQKCNVPVLKIEDTEADDVVATLVEQLLLKGHRVVIASPDKDFKQLISEDVQIVMPLRERGRWSYYTQKHYIAQYKCDPQSDLSFRCMMGDEVDGVPGLKHFVPGFGRKTALKLLKKHGTLDNLLNAAAVRTVGKPYAQDALTKYADYLRNIYEVLSLRRDVDVQLCEEWLSERDTKNDAIVLSNFIKLLGETRNHN
ncbi:hypothetical protein LguiA_018073 [Lonicera macranthoides]